MKIVIIGGGIAGLAAAISFRRYGHTVTVKERAPVYKEVGLGFIILPNGLHALDILQAGEYVRSNGHYLHNAALRDDTGKIFKTEVLSDSLAVKRSTCIDGLLLQLPKDIVDHDFDFSHFEYDETGKAIAVVSKKGEREAGDVFIGADGAGSAVRNVLFPDIQLRDSVIKELVGISDSPALAKQLNGKLLKTQSTKKGLSIGLLPCNDQELIWYIQYDSRNYDLKGFSNEEKKQFIEKLVGKWPDPINEVLANTDLSRAFLWKTRDMVIKDRFHKRNVILIGDAAHLALPFTSQGTNSALSDAIILSDMMEHITHVNQLEKIFNEFYQARKDVLLEYISFGRELEKIFLHPDPSLMDQIPIPLAT